MNLLLKSIFVALCLLSACDRGARYNGPPIEPTSREVVPPKNDKVLPAPEPEKPLPLANDEQPKPIKNEQPKPNNSELSELNKAEEAYLEAAQEALKIKAEAEQLADSYADISDNRLPFMKDELLKAPDNEKEIYAEEIAYATVQQESFLKLIEPAKKAQEKTFLLKNEMKGLVEDIIAHDLIISELESHIKDLETINSRFKVLHLEKEKIKEELGSRGIRFIEIPALKLSQARIYAEEASLRKEKSLLETKVDGKNTELSNAEKNLKARKETIKKVEQELVEAQRVKEELKKVMGEASLKAKAKLDALIDRKEAERKKGE